MKLTKEDIISPIPEGIVDGKKYTKECIDSCKLIKLSRLREVLEEFQYRNRLPKVYKEYMNDFQDLFGDILEGGV